MLEQKFHVRANRLVARRARSYKVIYLNGA